MKNETLERWSEYAPLLCRIALGAVFIPHGAQKLFGMFGGYGLRETAKVFTMLGLKPGIAMALLAGGAEFVGGILVLIGLKTRPAAFAIALVMAVATLKIHLRNGFFLNWAGTPGIGHGVEFTLTLFLVALSLVLSGGGKGSLDQQFKEPPGETPIRATPKERDPEPVKN